MVEEEQKPELTVLINKSWLINYQIYSGFIFWEFYVTFVIVKVQLELPITTVEFM